MSRGSIALMVLVALFGIGAILVAREFRTALSSPAGVRLASEQRLRNLAAALAAYRAQHRAWPENQLQLLRDRDLRIPAVAGVRYRRPAAGAGPDTVVLWREEPLPAVARGEPWGGDGQPASEDHPSVGHVVTADLRFHALPAADFRRRVPAATQP
jgi:hypothetical protein